MFETICVAYELGVIFYDMSYNGIDIDYHKFGEIAKKINPEMDYWKDW